MTKREICERLLEIRDQSSAGHLGPVGIGDALRDLILDLAVPEEEPKSVEEPEAEEKHPGIIVDPSGKHAPICLKCGGNLLPCPQPNLLYCRRCDKIFDKEEELKRSEEK